MVVLTGSATIRFGVADISDTESPAHSSEEGGIELHASAGDVFILPAGTAHKTHDTFPEAELKLLTPGDGHGVAPEDLEKVKLEGFTMMGAYPEGFEWDYAVGGDSEGKYERVWEVAKPERDPVLGEGRGGLCELW